MFFLIKSILIHEYQHNSTRTNTSQHESTRVHHKQHESDTNQHESTRVRNESTKVNRSKRVLDEATQVNKIRYESNLNLRIYNKLQKYLTQSFYLWLFFSGTMSVLYLTGKVSSQILYWTCLLFTLVWFLRWIVVTKRFLMPFY